MSVFLFLFVGTEHWFETITVIEGFCHIIVVGIYNNKTATGLVVRVYKPIFNIFKYITADVS